MKHLFTIIFAFITLSASAQITDADLSMSDTIYVQVETGTVESVDYYRLTYVEVGGGYRTYQRMPVQEVAPFLVTLASEKTRWEQSVSDIDTEIARLQARKLVFEAIVTELDDAITALE